MGMLQKGLQQLCEKSDNCRKIFAVHLKKKSSDKHEEKEILRKLCRCLMNPEYTLIVAECFPQILILLLSMVIVIETEDSNDTAETSVQVHRLNCVILGQLISINPDILGFSMRYFDIYPAPFETITNTSPAKKRSRGNQTPYYEVSEVSDYDIVHACYNILRAAPNHFKHNWNWSSFYPFLVHNNNKLQWIALKCIGIVLNMSNCTIEICANTLIPEYKKFLVNVERNQNDIALTTDNSGVKDVERAVENSNSLVSIGGVLLPVFDVKKRPQSTTLIPVPSMESNLRSLALAVASRKCVCLQGPVGCGKTALVEYLAQITGRGPTDFIKVQLGDQTDSKMLLGTYRCTDIPGEFVWQPGVLTQCVMSGKWLLLEDIDSAALDVASVLSNLMETGTLCVPGYRDTIYANSGFQLFVTQRLVPSISGFYRQSVGASNLLEKHWLCINMDPLTKNELVTIIQKLFPSLATIAEKMVNVFLLFPMGNHENDGAISKEEIFAMSSGRLISTRDLIKWCTRVIVDYDVSSRESFLKLLQDAIDIFCCSIADRNKRMKLAVSIEHTLGIVDKANYFVEEYKPSIFVHTEIFSAGRAKVQKKNIAYAQVEQTKVNFSFTRPSAALLERVTMCVAQKEPVLLVGETGTGKTSSIQFLAKSTGHKLTVINMNQQSESADLLGGYKPVDIKILITPIREEFEILFRSYYAIEPNKKFLEHIGTSYKHGNWRILVSLMCHSATAALKRLRGKATEELKIGQKRKGDIGDNIQKSANEHCQLLEKWEKLYTKIIKLKSQVKTELSLAFSFIEGSLIKALKEGYWVLLDEINLASSETLECLSGLLEGSSGSLSLYERGDSESIKRHQDFTIFACMNPATDVGKKELPVGLRNRFTEFYVDELTNSTDLHLLVNSYLANLNLQAPKHGAIVKFYLNVRKEATNSLNDGTGHKPHYSLRTLCRALSIAATNPCGNPVRSLYEAFCLSFLTQLDHRSYPTVEKMIAQGILDMKNMRAVVGAPIPKPKCDSNKDYKNFEGYWIINGELEPETPKNYILTSSVRRNLKDLVRVVSIGKMPVLLQGDTSVGKTSLITYLAKASGHVCVRINNHEHTDLQEYVGNYVADETGKLVFKEGVLVEAMRKGHWIILDELNLAPSDVLEALNRVLDDNRELFIPETQQTVKAHSNFMLFATQNPPGLYGGRKVLSRAFRNRFVELHFDEIPAEELQIILHERCHMPNSYCKQIISVMTELQMRRKSTAAFLGKQGFITLRDLFRWGERYRLALDVGENSYDWRQHLADEGYLVLAAKVRRPEEATEIQQVIKKHLKCNVDPENLFSLHEKTSSVTRPILEAILNTPIPEFKHIVWTYPMRRMAVMVTKSCQFKEPVLLVGETGGGKTTVCQLVAAMRNCKLFSVNCHMHTESSDFLGNLRPVREHSESNNQKLFEWVDGPLIMAMRDGDVFLADEISLADDSVLERMNSLLEPERSLLLAEKNTDSIDSNECNNVITAHEDFCFIGTMNPGGDYGKKELSPALRNRFTEIWCEGYVSNDDIKAIIQHNLFSNDQNINEDIANAILHFLDYLKTSEVGKKLTVSIRDVLTWVSFINSMKENNQSELNIAQAFTEGAYLTYLDSLGSGVTGTENKEKIEAFKRDLFTSIEPYVKKLKMYDEEMTINENNSVQKNLKEEREYNFGIEPFYIPFGPNGKSPSKNFTFTAPTTKLNTRKILRALQLHKPLLLEGSPGVGKTSLVSAIAKALGYNLLRINLSDQTDVSDLFGADLPVEGGKSGEFAWKDGPFLRALRAGDWILLDELNLASQSVLEGLNACLDHRGEIYIPELGRTFTVTDGTKLFACQNPLSQGGARRGLPKSFLNRFTQVFVEALSYEDLKIIAQTQFPHFQTWIDGIIDFNSNVSAEIGKTWGHSGAPWEMNLRDITRWCELINTMPETRKSAMIDAVRLLYVDRMRTEYDRNKMRALYFALFDETPLMIQQPLLHVDDKNLYFDDVVLPRTENSFSTDHNLFVLRSQISILKSLAQCVQMNWMPILVGASGTGKSSVVRVLAQLAGQKLRSIVVNSAMDTTEILGGFEQTDYNRHLEEIIEETQNLLIDTLRTRLNKESLQQVTEFHRQLEKIQNLSSDSNSMTTMAMETELFLRRTQELSKLISAMKTIECSLSARSLTVIENKLKNLSDLVKQDNCLNAGGKFEWVDSVLVKCLKDGSWLLVDQVNLCSPAVLDRLNGLLEPGGVLTIGERGVDNDGNIHTIKPHKNFRLFLTMDPRYGEISRAMRNRGVEIFLFENNHFDGKNILDVRSMMFDVGLTANNHQDTLLEIHHEILSEGRCADKLSTIQLLHSAFLITQQISRGFSVKDAFTNACIDVYIKSKYIYQPEIKEHLLSIINTNIKKYNIDKCIESTIDLSSATLNIRNLQDNAKITIVKQQAILLTATVDKFRRETTVDNSPPITTQYFNEYFKLNHNNTEDINCLVVDIKKIYPYLLFLFYIKSSVNDVTIRQEWLEKYIARNRIIMSDREKIIIEKMTKKVLTSAEDLGLSTQPWYSHVLSAKIDDAPFSGAISMSMALYLICFDINNFETPQLNKLSNKHSIEEYSYGLHKKLITKQKHCLPFIEDFYPFILKMNEWLSMYVNNYDRTNDNTSFIEFLLAVQWFKRFYELGKNLFIEVSGSNENRHHANIEALLLMHYNWIKNYLLVLDHSLGDKLTPMMDKFDRRLHDRFIVRKRAMNVKNQLHYPPPLKTEAIATTYQNLYDTADIFSLISHRHNYFQRKLIHFQVEDALQLRSDVIKVWKDVLNLEYDAIDDVTLSRIDRFDDCDNINEIFNNLSHGKFMKLAANTTLWPIYQYTFYLFVNKLHRELNDCTNILPVEINIDPNVISKFIDMPCIPPNVIAIIDVIINKAQSKLCYKHLLPELFSYLTLYRGGNWHTDDLCLSMMKHNLSSDDDDDYYDQSHESPHDCNYSKNTPALIITLTATLISSEISVKNNHPIILIGPLEMCNTHIKQLRIINNMLWRNSISFNSKQYNTISNDKRSLLSYIKPYLRANIRAKKSASTEYSNADISPTVLNADNDLEPINDHDFNEDVEFSHEMIKYSRQLYNTLTLLNHSDNDHIDHIRRGLGWIYMGCHQLVMFTHLDITDPIINNQLKAKYYSEDMENLRTFIYANNLDSYICGDGGWMSRINEMADSLIEQANKSLIAISKKHVAAVNSIGYRSPNSSFDDFSAKVTIIRNLSCLEQTVDCCEFVHLNIANYNSRPYIHWVQDMNEGLDILSNHQHSWCRLFEKWKSEYLGNYREYVIPILNAMSYIIHGVDIVLDEADYCIAREKTNFDLTSTAEYFLHNLVRFPTIGPNQEDLLQLIDLYTSQSGREFIEKNLGDNDLSEEFRINITLTMIKNGLYELYNYVNLTKQLTPAVWNGLNQLLAAVILVWQKQRIENDRIANETASSYKYKIHMPGDTLTEEEEIDEQLKELFPTYHSDDYMGLHVPALEPSLEVTEYKTFSMTGLDLLHEDDLHEVYDIHSKIVRSTVTAPWIKPIDLTKRNYIDPLIQRFKTFSLLLPSLEKSVTSNLSTKLHMSFNMLTTISTSMNSGKDFATDINDVKTPEKPYDFYNSSNIKKVEHILPLLENLRDKVEVFLNEWPDHPTLKSICQILERINEFPITSPVSRFLIGFELLLTKMREWEENAHSGVSLSEYTTSLTQQIIDWRRLELDCWKDCLNSAFERLKAKASKWWFFLYSLIESYTTKSSMNINHSQQLFNSKNVQTSEAVETNEVVTAKKFIELLDIFMSQSSLVEFQARLDLLLTFHCHVFYLEMSTERSELLAIFWNIYHYYSKFSEDIEKKINSIKAPIEKKLRDFVKIARWNDINFWSVKETVEKTHRTLLKFIREYEKELKQNAGACLLIKPTSYTTEANKGEWDRSKDRDYAINPRDFIISKDEIKEINVPFMEKGDLISRMNKNLTVATDLCKKTILMSSYPGIRVELEHLIEDFINRGINLKNMEVDRSLPKPKQKTHAKSILQQKKRALADYFRVLTNIGVSYRRGIHAWQHRQSDVLNMTIAPLDVSTTMKKLECLSIPDKQMLAQWDGCDSYYYKCCIKLQALHSAMGKIQTDLGPQNVERCRGYSTHIMLMAHEEKKLLAESFHCYIRLRKLIANISNIDNGYVSLPYHEHISICADLLKKLLTCLLTGLEQLELYLYACPEQTDNDIEEQSIVLEPSSFSIIHAYKNDAVWQSANTLIKDAIKSVNSIFESHSKHFDNTSISLIRTPIHFDSLKNSRESLGKIATMIENFGKMFGNDDEKSHPILETVEFLVKQTNRWIEQFNVMKIFDSGPTPQYDSDLKYWKMNIKNIIETILLVIQKKYKEAEAQNDDEVRSDGENKENHLNDDTGDEEISKLEENGFREKLIEALSKDIATLQLGEIDCMLERTLKITHALDPSSASFYNSVLLKCLPIFKQYLLLVQFYLNEQVAAFRTTCKLLYLQLNVFLDLATNGFCVPKDLDLEDGEADPEGTEQSTDQGGMGLGDGEGKKDVSDRIESEDQLEDARPADEEKKDEDKDCKEEDGGIEMSENFDGKMQDIDDNTDNENDEKSDDEDNKDLDKEMGDTEKGADQLDEEIWGNDEDENDIDEQNDNTDEQGKGEQIGEKELSAKEESKNTNDDKNGDKENRDENDEQEKKEINEINEPDVNDDQIDPYHGKHDPQPEPEPMDLPEDLNLDGDDEGKEDKTEGDENPFDIDEMKETMPPEKENIDVGEDPENENDKNADENAAEDSSDEEGDGPTLEDTQMQDLDAADEDNAKEPEASNQQVAESNKEEEEKKSDEDNEENKNAGEDEKASPSVDDASKEMDSAEQSECKVDGSRDKVANQQKQDEKQESMVEENSQENGDDKGTGQAQSEEQSEGHVGSAMQKNTSVQKRPREENMSEERKKPGESDENRALVDEKQPNKKKQKIHNREELAEADEENAEGPEQDEDGEVDMCQHVKDSEKYDSHAFDAATEEQVKTQQIANSDDEEVAENKDDSMDIDMQPDVDKTEEEEIKPINSEATPKTDKDEEKPKSKSKATNNVEDNANMENKIDVEGENVETIGAARATESAFYTNIVEQKIPAGLTQVERKRLEVEQMLSQWTYVPSTGEALAAWNCLSAVTEGPARDLSEKLRLVLEPTQATRLKGDYRTGKRINMRKIIPYIASQFRKDKIWLRRTKPSKRDYQIILALDDSSSMADNHSKELAFESLSLISKAMGYLEVGQLSVISFGESPKVLHPLGEPFTEHSGSRLIQEMRFDQKKTMMGQLVDFTVDMFESQKSSTDNAKLLVVLSDGRGIFSEGVDYVNRAVRRAKLADIFLVFIIVENPQNKDSILDIRMPVFENGKLLEIRPYMDSFPFPFYMILRDINALPGVLSDALRQWFEVVGKIDT